MIKIEETYAHMRVFEFLEYIEDSSEHISVSLEDRGIVFYNGAVEVECVPHPDDGEEDE